MMARVFAYGPGDLSSIPDQVIPKTRKCYLMPPCLTLSIIRYGSRVYLGVVATEKGAFGSPSNTVTNLLYLSIYNHILAFNVSISYQSLLHEFPVDSIDSSKEHTVRNRFITPVLVSSFNLLTVTPLSNFAFVQIKKTKQIDK